MLAQEQPKYQPDTRRTDTCHLQHAARSLLCGTRLKWICQRNHRAESMNQLAKASCVHKPVMQPLCLFLGCFSHLRTAVV